MLLSFWLKGIVTHPQRFKCESEGENNKRRNWGMLLNLQHFGCKRGVLELLDGTRKSDKWVN
jgi:hypothetical protein